MVEELTLYLIDQNKLMVNQKQLNADQSKLIQYLNNRIENPEKKQLPF